MSSIQISKRKIAVTVAEVLLLTFLVAFVLFTFYWIGGASADTGSGSAVPPTPSVPPDLDNDLGGYLEQAFNAGVSGNWTAVTALVLIGATWVARKPWALGKIKFFSTDRGGVVMALGLSLIGGFASSIIAMGKFPTDLATYKAIAMTAVTAMGGYVALKRIIWPADKKPDAPALP